MRRADLQLVRRGPEEEEKSIANSRQDKSTASQQQAERNRTRARTRRSKTSGKERIQQIEEQHNQHKASEGVTKSRTGTTRGEVRTRRRCENQEVSENRR